MTLEELLGKSASEWDALTPEELTLWASKYFSVTKPEEAQKTHLQLALSGSAPKTNKTLTKRTNVSSNKLADTLKEIERLRKQHGI